MNASQHVHYMMALFRLMGRLDALTAEAVPHRGQRLAMKTKALVEFDRRITGTD